MLEILNELRERMFVYRKNKLSAYEFNEFNLRCCTSIELSVIYVELYYRKGRRIAKNELVYFKGGRFISDIIGSESEYKDIYDWYFILCREINKVFYK